MITYQTEGVDMPAIKKRETSAWIKAVAETYSLGRTGSDALATAYTFGVIRRFCYIDIHFAHLCTFPTGYAFVPVNLHSQKRHLVHQSVKCTEWAYPFAKRTVKQHTQNYNGD